MQAPGNLRKQVEYKDEILNASKTAGRRSEGLRTLADSQGPLLGSRRQAVTLFLQFSGGRSEKSTVRESTDHTPETLCWTAAQISASPSMKELAAGAKTVVAIEARPRKYSNVCAAIIPVRSLPGRRNHCSERCCVGQGGFPHPPRRPQERIPPPTASSSSVKAPLTCKRCRSPQSTSWWPNIKLPRVDYIKFDIEGAEPKALAGAKETLSQFRPRISIASYHEPDHPKVIPEIHPIRPRPTTKCAAAPAQKPKHSIRPDVLYFK